MSVFEELQDLKQHEHIESVTVESPKELTIKYCPTNVHSPYNNHTYVLKLSISEGYPEKPPKVRFQSSIYHLNVDSKTGQVRMAILEDDWSPFLSLLSVIQSLYRILEQPEQQYAANNQLLALYQHQRQNYLKNIECLTGNNQITDPIYTNQSNQEVESEQESESLSENISKIVMEFKQSLHHRDQMTQHPSKTNTLHSFKENVLNPVSRNTLHPFMDQLYEQPQTAYFKSPSGPPSSVKQELLKVNNEGTNNIFPSPLKDLHLLINKSLNIFINEINELQKQIEITSNQTIRSLLAQSRDKQIQMIRQVVTISVRVKQKIIILSQKSVQCL